VAHGVVEIMNLLGVVEVEPDEYLKKSFYPVYTQIKGHDLYEHPSIKLFGKFYLHRPISVQIFALCVRF
jgi:hypothetical protein